MTPRKRVLLLITIMAIVVLATDVAVFKVLYHVSMDEMRSRLEDTVKSQARLIESIARFDSKLGSGKPINIPDSVLSQINDAHQHYQESGETTEFTIARRHGDHFDFLLSNRQYDYEKHHPVPAGSGRAEPMAAALSGRSGTMIGRDYRGVVVLAAFEPVAVMNLGIVAKVDITEIRRPFIRAAVIGGMIGVIAILAGAALFFYFMNPLVRGLESANSELQRSLETVKQLSGLLPICASCKKIRDDNGSWTQLEWYIHEHSEAEFTHGICPECARKLYPNHGVK